jgi:1-acyl-sn-glycerol-3-phosphate acyltransferase
MDYAKSENRWQADRQTGRHSAKGTTSSWSDFWHDCLFHLIEKAYFARVTLLHGERLPQAGPVLYLGLHRNGAVDGFVYHQVLRKPVFMISTQLRKNLFSRLLFRGIAVTRPKDEGDRSLNETALHRCLDQLRSGGELFVFPEGTSSLGPRHLPFKSGAIWLLLDYLDAGGPPLQVIPIGIHYECPWDFQARVEVVVGHPISTELPAGAGQFERLREMKQRVKASLEEVGINVPSEGCQSMIQQLARLATMGTSRSYFKSLKALEKSVPDNVVAAWNELQLAMQRRRPWLHQGVPLLPMRPIALYYAALLLLAPLVGTAMVLNFPPLLGGWFAGKKFPDDRNVISLWRILVGIPVFILWAGIVALIVLLLGKPLLLAAYTFVTLVGVKLYHRVKKWIVAVHNGLLHPELRPRMLTLREMLLSSLPNES